ncbi:MAG: hypothetical protein JST81_10110 [Bacteroidetes bacterium]|nr:hypothetical protein [Bacteroidota bacterium]
MIFKKDNFIFGMIIGLLAPLMGLMLFKWYKFGVFTFKETFQFMVYEPGFKTLTVGLSLSLLLSALMFTLYINAGKDKTAKGIFAVTMIYGLFILIVKTIY